MIYVKMLNVHRWHRTWSGLVVEPDTIGELKEIRDGLFSVLWPGQVRAVLCLPTTVEVVEQRRTNENSSSRPRVIIERAGRPMTIRVVLDANQFVSAVLVPVGHPAQILDASRRGDLDILISPPILAEVRRVLLYPRLQERHGWDKAQVDSFLEGVWAAAIVTPETTAVEEVPHDPSHTKYLACALEGSAQYVITGDRHLLRLDPWRGIRIIPPAVFLEVAPG